MIKMTIIKKQYLVRTGTENIATDKSHVRLENKKVFELVTSSSASLINLYELVTMI